MKNADGSILLDVSLNTSDVDKELGKLKKKIKATEDTVAETREKRDEARDKSALSAAQLDAEKAKLEEIKDRLQEIRALARDKTVGPVDRGRYANMVPEVQGELTDQQARVQMLQREYNSLDASVVRYDQKLADATEKLNAQKTEAGKLVQQIEANRGAAAKMGEAVDRAGSYMEKFTHRVKKLASRVFVFTIITTALRALRGWMSKAVKTNDEAVEAMARLKGALLTLAQPLVEVIIPAFTVLVNILARVVQAIASVLSMLFGKTAKQSAEAAKNLNDQVEALDGVSGAAQDAEKSMAGFDEVNTIGGAGSEGGGGGNSGIKPDFSTEFADDMAGLTALASAALLALGVILTFSGVNIPLGIALIAAGAVGLVSAVMGDPGAVVEMLRGPIGDVVALVSSALLALGIILCCLGVNLPLGVALIALGAAGLASAVAVNWGWLSEQLQGPIGVITGIVSGAFLFLGTLLCCTGVALPLGIALIAAGAVGLVATVAANWSWLSEKLKGTLGAVVAAVSFALLVFGIILCCTGVAIPLAVPLIAAGAAGLVATIAANWSWLSEKLTGTLGAVTAAVSVFLLVLGIILCCTGVGIPLGIALIAAGAIGLVTVAAVNWNFMLDKLKGAWQKIKDWFSTHVAKFFTLDYWAGLGRQIIDGLLNGLKAAWDAVVGWVTSAIDWVKGLFGGAKKEIKSVGGGSPGAPTGSGTGPAVSTYSYPRLAQGAVIPPNREFMAVLGDQKRGMNIEAPLETMVQAFRQVMAESGGSRPVTVVLELDKREFGRAVYRANNDETQRVGVRLAGVST